MKEKHGTRERKPLDFPGTEVSRNAAGELNLATEQPEFYACLPDEGIVMELVPARLAAYAPSNVVGMEYRSTLPIMMGKRLR